VNTHDHLTVARMSLIDRGTNGGFPGEYDRNICHTHRSFNEKESDHPHLNNIGIGTVQHVVQTPKGPSIPNMHRYALTRL
jgi:hypothetical protein